MTDSYDLHDFADPSHQPPTSLKYTVVFAVHVFVVHMLWYYDNVNIAFALYLKTYWECC